MAAMQDGALGEADLARMRRELEAKLKALLKGAMGQGSTGRFDAAVSAKCLTCGGPSHDDAARRKAFVTHSQHEATEYRVRSPSKSRGGGTATPASAATSKRGGDMPSWFTPVFRGGFRFPRAPPTVLKRNVWGRGKPSWPMAVARTHGSARRAGGAGATNRRLARLSQPRNPPPIRFAPRSGGAVVVPRALMPWAKKLGPN